MRASPAVEVVVCRFEWWRLAVGAAAAGGLMVVGLWALGQPTRVGFSVAAALALALIAIAAAASTCIQMRPTRLRWDGDSWHVSDGVLMRDNMASGRMEVAIDLGGWMLLRLWPDETPPFYRRSRWLPVQRRGLELQWHALRCAVYSGAPRATLAVTPEL